MIVPRGIVTYPSYPKRRFQTTMRPKTMTTKNMIKFHKGHSTNYTPPTPAPPARSNIIVPRGITAYQSLPYRRFRTTMKATTMTTNTRRKFQKGHSTHALSSRREADDSTQRNYNRPIYSRKVVPNDYDRDNDNNR